MQFIPGFQIVTVTPTMVLRSPLIPAVFSLDSFMNRLFETQTLLLMIALTATVVLPVMSQETTTEEKSATQAEPEVQQSPEELYKQIQQLARTQPESRTREAVRKHLKDLSSKILKLADQILEQKTDDEMAARAVRAKFEMLDLQTRLGETLAPLQAKQFAKKVADDERPAIARIGKAKMIEDRAEKAFLLKSEDRKKLVEDLISFIGEEKPDKTAIRLAINVTRGLERTKDKELVVSAYEQTAELLAKSDIKGVEGIVEKFKGSARRLSLPGEELRLVGKTFDGEDFDWSSYKGKVVLVDFWATWCPTCVAKMPRFVELYREFHDQGLEIVGVNVDENPLRLSGFLNRTPLPWTQLFGDKNGRPGSENVNADYYGVSALPTVFLVGKDGKVVSVDALNDDLKDEIKKQLAKKSS